MLLSYLILVFFVLAFLDLRGVAAARRKARHHAARLYLAQEIPKQPNIHTQELPEPLRRYLHQCGAQQTPIGTIRMRQKGILRLGTHGDWKPWEGKSFIGARMIPDVVWYADITLGLLRSRAMWYQWIQQSGQWEDTLWGISLPKSPIAVQQALAFTCFQATAAIPWQPLTLTHLTWKALSDTVFEAVHACNGIPLTLQLHTNSAGLPIRLMGTLDEWRCTVQYFDYQKLPDGILRPLQWREEVQHRDKTLFLEGRVTDLATGGSFSWW